MMQLTDQEMCDTIRAYAACNMNRTAAAHQMYIHPNTLLYRLERIQAVTGLDPRSFADLGKLVALTQSYAKAETLAKRYTVRDNLQDKIVCRNVSRREAAAAMGLTVPGLQSAVQCTRHSVHPMWTIWINGEPTGQVPPPVRVDLWNKLTGECLGLGLTPAAAAEKMGIKRTFFWNLVKRTADGYSRWKMQLHEGERRQ